MDYETAWIIGILLPIIYFSLRCKGWMRFVFDGIVITLSLLILYIFIAPHRIEGFKVALDLIFR